MWLLCLHKNWRLLALKSMASFLMLEDNHYCSAFMLAAAIVLIKLDLYADSGAFVKQGFHTLLIF